MCSYPCYGRSHRASTAPVSALFTISKFMQAALGAALGAAFTGTVISVEKSAASALKDGISDTLKKTGHAASSKASRLWATPPRLPAASSVRQSDPRVARPRRKAVVPANARRAQILRHGATQRRNLKRVGLDRRGGRPYIFSRLPEWNGTGYNRFRSRRTHYRHDRHPRSRTSSCCFCP